MFMTADPDAQRRLANKRYNERIRLIYTAANTLALGIIGAAFIVPGVSSVATIFETQRAIWFLAAAGLHVLAQAVVGFLRSEE